MLTMMFISLEFINKYFTKSNSWRERERERERERFLKTEYHYIFAGTRLYMIYSVCRNISIMKKKSFLAVCDIVVKTYGKKIEEKSLKRVHF
jgi:hypothetical protein